MAGNKDFEVKMLAGNKDRRKLLKANMKEKKLGEKAMKAEMEDITKLLLN